MSTRPTVGLLGIGSPSSEHDLAEHHEGFLAQVGRRLASVADVISGVPATSADQLAASLAAITAADADGVSLVLLGDGTHAGCATALDALELPLLILNVQPERAVGVDWSPYDLRFNAGVAGAQTLAGELATADVRFAALTGDWLSDGFVGGFEDWARAARASHSVTSLPAGELLVGVAQLLLDESAGCRIRAMDWNRDALLIDPSPTLAAVAGPLTTAALTHLQGGELRLVVGSGELLEAAVQLGDGDPQLFFAPDAGLEAFMDAWLELGSPAEFVIAPGERRERWRRLAEMLESEYEEI